MDHEYPLKPLAGRINLLGTETAYAVSDEAKTLSKSKKIYPFHIGDLNFPTPKVFVDGLNEAISKGMTGYCPAAGIETLRTKLAEEIGNARGVNYDYTNVSIQSGGKPVIWKFLAVVMETGTEVLYPSPGYPIYESMIRYLGGVPVPYSYLETENGFELDLPRLKSLVSNKTSALIYNNFQNPMGASSTDEEMEDIATICVEHNLWVLSDEAYFDIVYEIPSKSIVSMPGMFQRTVILHTYSKSFSMTGWRLGAAIGPKDIITHINRLNTNDEACTTHFIQQAGLCLSKTESLNFLHHTLLPELKQRRDLIVPLLNEVPGFTAHMPKCTFYIFVNVTEAMNLLNITSLEAFRKLILNKTGIAFCTREHFGQSLESDTAKYVRFAYSGITCEQITESMALLKDFMSKPPKSN